MANTLVLLHGVGQGPMAWQDVITTIAQQTGRSRIRAPWLPGMRPNDPSAFSIDGAAGDVARSLELAGDAPVLLCGQSLGAMVAIRVAAQFPELVDGLVLAAPLVNPPRAALWAQKQMLKLVPASKFAAEGISKDRLLSVMGELGRIDLRADLAKIACKTTVLVGEGDGLNKAAAKDVAAKISGAQFATVPGGGQLNTESPTEFAQQLTARWLEEEA